MSLVLVLVLVLSLALSLVLLVLVLAGVAGVAVRCKRGGAGSRAV